MAQSTNAKDKRDIHNVRLVSTTPTVWEEIRGTKNGSLVHRFITSGKPGNCSFCEKFVNKLEAHHVQYRPEKTIKLCHDCHHKTHFWTLRLSHDEKLKMLKLIHPDKQARQLAADKSLTNIQLAKLIAPSRSGFVHAQQKAFTETGEMQIVPAEIKPRRKIDIPKLMFNKKKHL